MSWFYLWHQNTPGGAWYFGGHFYGALHQAQPIAAAMRAWPWRITDSANVDVQPFIVPPLKAPSDGLAKGQEHWWTL